MTMANKLGCELIDVRQPFLAQKQYCRFLCEDGIHPNQEGHLLMKKAFNAFAMEKL
jgi:lysophospholipase L1-like esterase